jgi:two-component SAPR family response regulator
MSAACWPRKKQNWRRCQAQLATDVLIIEDEALIALDLEALVENLGHKVIGVARTRTEAVTIVRTKPPGLILADIRVADGSSGLDAVNDPLNTFEVPVIFITAYPERFLTGEWPEPAFLISKPYRLRWSVRRSSLNAMRFSERNGQVESPAMSHNRQIECGGRLGWPH